MLCAVSVPFLFQCALKFYFLSISLPVCSSFLSIAYETVGYFPNCETLGDDSFFFLFTHRQCQIILGMALFFLLIASFTWLCDNSLRKY